jgi:hypothetical protein
MSSTSHWGAITYRGFHDVPRFFIVADGEQTYLFDCTFDEDLDDYPDDYTIYLMPALEPADLNGSWENLHSRAVALLGKIAVSDLIFDETLRKSIDLDVLSRITRST